MISIVYCYILNNIIQVNEVAVNTIEYAQMEKMESTYWWHVGRLRIIERECERHLFGMDNVKILNIGCGTGGTVDTLQKFGEVHNVDVSDEALGFMKRKGYKNLYKVSGIKLPFPDNTFDAVGAFDVLEHIELDKEALREWRRVLKPGGKLLITVPAYQWLWSQHDTSLHHFRRYTKMNLWRKLEDESLEIRRISYAIVFSFPLVAGFRILKSLSRGEVTEHTSYVAMPKIINELFIKLLQVESWAHRWVNFPFGTSVLAVSEK